ncbi:hypothetical protein JXZ90_01760 [Mycoplasma sp. Mirounga ES2805-ORL]|nr:hypothetical protein JXZ90_01760 [Mycoplasma sp. Mirounga ES2805-ORL]
MPVKKAIWLVVLPSLMISLMVGLYTFIDSIFIQQFVPRTRMIFDTSSGIKGEIYSFLDSGIPRYSQEQYNSFFNLYKNVVPELNGNLITSTCNASFQPIVIFSNSIVFLIPIGGSVFYSKCIGKNLERSGKDLWATLFWTTLVLSLIATIISFIFASSGLLDYIAGTTHLKNTKIPEADAAKWQPYYDAAHRLSVSWAKQYIYLYAAGTFMQGLSLYLSYFIRSEGYSNYAMGVSIVSNIINIVLDAILIIVFKLGVMGGIIATLVGWFFNLAAFLIYLSYMNKKQKTWLMLSHLFKFKFNKKLLGPTILIGLGGFFRSFGIAISFAVLNILLTKTSYQLAGQYQFQLAKASPILSLLIISIYGINDGARPMLSYNFARNKISRCKEIYWWTMLVAIVYAISSYIFVAATAQAMFVHILNTAKAAQPGVAKFIRVITLRVIFISFSISSVLIFQGTNDIGRTMIASVIESLLYVLIIAPISYFIGLAVFKSTGGGNGLNEASNYVIIISFVVNCLFSSAILFGYSWWYISKKMPNLSKEKLSWGRKIENQFIEEAIKYEKEFNPDFKLTF